MKKYIKLLTALFAILLSVAVSAPVHAQNSASPTKDSLNGADTAYSYIPVVGLTAVTSVQPVFVKKSGTVAGKVYIDGTVTSTIGGAKFNNWVIVDSLTLSDAAPNIFGVNPNTKVFNFTNVPYTQLRVRYVTTGGQGYIRTFWITRN